MSNYMLISLILPNGKYTTEKDCATYVPRVYAYALHQSLFLFLSSLECIPETAPSRSTF